MALSKKEFTRYIRQFQFRELFNDMGWNNDKTNQSITVDTLVFNLKGVAEKSGFKVLVCSPNDDGLIPDYNIRRKIELKVTKLFQEHLIIFVDSRNQEQIWQLVVRQTGKPAKATETRYHISQDPELLFQRASGIFFELDEEEKITIVDVTQRITENFHQNNERVTKQFYEKFSKEHTSFLKFIKGIEDTVNKEWYASLMLNRLMFCYFIQKKGFLDNNKNYLWDKLKASQERKGKNKFYSFYRSFLLTLFHQGLGAPDHSKEVKDEIGRVPYLNGGLFEEHELEATNPKIDIDDKAFERIFEFFDQYEWHLDTRQTANGKDINPDVIGYIFEKYINDRADMGAYYTKEDITDYISKNCVLPFLFDETKRHYSTAFASDGEIWQRVKVSSDEYIYDAIKHGVNIELPKEITKGIKSVAERTEWNRPATPEFALPTEIWREVVERRNRYSEGKGKIEKGEIQSIDDFITYNLNISQFVQDVVENTNDTEFLKEFYKALNSVTIIDPTCGSGAFLFAAMNILEPLYEACIMRMRAFVEDEDRANKEQKATFSHKHKYFREVLENIQNPQHPNLQYFIYKSIILRNLYGVDIMKEAVEIAKLRLFLKLVATVEADFKKPNLGLEPLPDIDFNIRAGNTLIGFATEAELKKGLTYTLDGLTAKPVIEEKCDIVAKTFKRYKEIQLTYGDDYREFKKAKEELNKRLKELNHELNQLLYKQTPAIKYDKWLVTHQPFHWFAEFYEIIHNKSGFDVVIGNPPYIDFKMGFSYQVGSHYLTYPTKNLYALVLERCSQFAKGRQGYIVPISSTSTEGFLTLQKILLKKNLHISTFDDRPSHLFDGLNKNTLSIILISNAQSRISFTTDFLKWNSIARPYLFQSIKYEEVTATTLKGCIPKVGNRISRSIWNKINSVKSPLALCYSNAGTNKSYYSRKINSFLQSLDFIPQVFDGNDNLRPPSEFKELKFKTEIQSKVVYCLLNSTLFKWFIDTTSDGSHLNKREIDSFPIDLETDQFDWMQFNGIAKRLTASLQSNSEFRVMRYSHDTLRIQCIFPKLSKLLIDEIDKALAKYYSLTDEELDFIINYDIKYRMGKELEDQD